LAPDDFIVLFTDGVTEASYLRPLFPEQRIAGLAHTVQGAPIQPWLGREPGIERITSYLQVFEDLTPDSVLVSVTPDTHVGHLGELCCNSALRHGCVGAILDGNLRDIEGIRDIGFQVFYRDLSPLNAIGRWEMVASQVPVTIGDVTVHPGDVILAEFDGILVIPRDDAERVLERAEEIEGAEKLVREEMREGESPLASLDRHGYI
ncbi:MAG: RraA family protein, partial [bacterium]|nr:RraA family protein [bacterium]